MVVCVDQHRWVAKFVGISGLWLGSSALVDCGWVRQHQWVAWVGFVVVDVGVATDQPQTHATDRSACSPIGWVFGEFLFCLVCVEEKKMEIWVFFFFFWPIVDWWWWCWLWLMVEVVVAGAVYVFWVVRYIILL